MEPGEHKARQKTQTILRILHEAGQPMGASRIARELCQHGFLQSERMVRNYLEQLDQLGLTENRGRAGRAITRRGIAELSRVPVVEKLGFVAARADTLAYQMSFDLPRQSGTLIANVSLVPVVSLQPVLDEFERVLEWKLGFGDQVAYALPGETLGGQQVPEGYLGIATICSLTMNGIFLKAGIPTTSVFGGLLEIENGNPIRFTQIIRYDGTTIDPLEIFIQGGMTSVSKAVRTDRGCVGAGFREVPSAARPHVMELREQLEAIGLGGILYVGAPNQPVFDIPVSHGRTGVVVLAGLNPIAAVHERGFFTRNHAMCTLIDRREMVHYSYLRKRLLPLQGARSKT